MTLNGLKICWSKKVKGEKRLECGESVNDSRIIEETMRLISEFLDRVERHKSALLSDLTTPFDRDINALSDWLNGVVIVVDGDEAITELRMAEREVGEKMLALLNQVREKWLRVYRQELEELVRKLRRGEATIIISGEPFDRNKSFIVHLYTENLAIIIARVAESESITSHISLTGLGGIDVIVPKSLNDKGLRAIQCGLLLTDGSIDRDDYPVMGTNRLWQVVVFTMVFPGKIHMIINGLNVNNGDVSVIWQLRAIDHKDAFGSKAEVVEVAGGLGDDEFPLFLLFVVLGDGNVNVKERRVRLYMGYSKLELWGDLIERLEGLGFREEDEGHKVAYMVKSSKAANLTKKMLSNPIIKAIIEDLARLPDAEKLRRLIELANVKVKPPNKSSIEVVDGVKMTIRIGAGGIIELRTWRKDYREVMKILEKLRDAGYKETKLSKWGEKFTVYMSMDVIKKYPELISKVCEVLRKIYDEAMNEDNMKKARTIAKAIRKLGCQ
ncbi:MAG: hypothetical protein ACP5GZ_01415 [Vulcanisaeta sp.]|uniref:hypothetical protein n=1 Tax=Vulcanisaeta sp. TaxID=2020871 RepID=UPI003D11BA26